MRHSGQRRVLYGNPVKLKTKGKRVPEWRPCAPIKYNTKASKVTANDDRKNIELPRWFDILLRFTVSFVSCYLILRFMG